MIGKKEEKLMERREKVFNILWVDRLCVTQYLFYFCGKLNCLKLNMSVIKFQSSEEKCYLKDIDEIIERDMTKYFLVKFLL